MDELLLLDDLLINGIDFFNPDCFRGQNGTHAFRFRVLHLTRTKFKIISYSEYLHLLKLEKTHDLYLRLGISLWHWGYLIPNGEWSYLFHYTSQPSTYFHGISNPVNNIPLNNNVFRYSNRPLLVRSNDLIRYVEISNDINLLPENLINLSVRELVINSNRAMLQAWAEVQRGGSIIELQGSAFNLVENFDDSRYYEFNYRIRRILEDERDLQRQVDNIVRYQGEGFRRLLQF